MKEFRLEDLEGRKYTWVLDWLTRLSANSWAGRLAGIRFKTMAANLNPQLKKTLEFRSRSSIPLTISTTKRVNTCLIPSPVSWRFQKKKDPSTSFCSKRACTVSCSGVPFGTQKSDMHFVVIYFGMRCVVPETPKPSSASHARPARIIKRRNVRKNLALATGGFIF